MFDKANTRRTFLAKADALAAGSFALIANPLGLAPRTGGKLQTSAPPQEVGELYAGFVLVQPGMPHPSPLKLPALGPPILESIAGGPAPTGHSETLSAAEARALGVDLWTLRGMAPTEFGATFTGSRLWSVTVIAADANELVSIPTENGVVI